MLERVSRREALKLLVLGIVGLGLSDGTRKTEKPKPTITIPTDTAQEILVTPLETLIKPFLEEARVRRFERAQGDPEYSHRIDQELNQNRINFLLFGYGETHEPPLTEKAIIGSFTILSYNSATRKIDFVSLTHDIRAPEIERYQKRQGKHDGQAIKIDKAYQTGGFSLMREVLENATGFSIDFQMAFSDAVIKDLIDSLFDELEVNVPADFEAYPFYFEGKKYPRGRFRKGRQKIDGLGTLQFIKTVPVENVSTELEHNRRKYLVFEAMFNVLKEKATSPLFWPRVLMFLNNEIGKEVLTYDFDLKSMVINNIGTIVSGFGRFITSNGLDSKNAPKINRTLYVVDISSGDGGVRWVNADINENHITKKDIEAGVYPDRAMEIPSNANPYSADLVAEYWPSVRSLIKKRLLS